MDAIIGQVFELLKPATGSGMVQNILLMLIWMSVRSLNKKLEAMEASHDNRIGKLETKVENHEGRLIGGGI